tara:strand:+ start:1014 stop:1184 length:171 start_codon:yes stop_codon:yes gene_type:complete
MYRIIKNIFDNEKIIIENLQTGYQFQESSHYMYQEYLAWLAEGNEPLPADEPQEQP